MGLLQVGKAAAEGVLADQWREYFYCPALEANVLVRKGEARKSGKRNFNNKSSDNIISNGSIIAVNAGQCMMIVDQGAIVEVCAEPGEFVYDTSKEPSIFVGGLKDTIVESFKTFGRRFSFAGDTAREQRIYFFNTKEIYGNKYGTANPIPFRVVDTNVGLDIDISVRCHGEYAYKIQDPILFYKNICGNVEEDFTRDRIDSQLKSDLLTKLQPAFAEISAKGVRYSAVPGHAEDMANILNELLSEMWAERYGITISTFGVNSIKASEEDENMIKELQKSLVYSNAGMAAAHLTMAQAEAMKLAASNDSAGPMMAFAGMNMAAQSGGINAQSLFQMAQQQKAENQPMQAAPARPTAPAAEGWTCSCGATGNTGKFCMECGSKRPEAAADGWFCQSCGTKNKGKFCTECGSKKPAGVPQYKCDKCGWEPADPKNPPRFCPECGDPFDDGDIV